MCVGEGVHSVCMCISGYDCTSAVSCNQGGMAYVLVLTQILIPNGISDSHSVTLIPS